MIVCEYKATVKSATARPWQFNCVIRNVAHGIAVLLDVDMHYKQLLHVVLVRVDAQASHVS